MIVVDASAFLSVVLGEPSSDAVLRALLGEDGGRSERRSGEVRSEASIRKDGRREAPERVAPKGGSDPGHDEVKDEYEDEHEDEHEDLIAPECLALEVTNAIVQLRRRAQRLGMNADPASVIGVEPDRLARAIQEHFETLGVTLESVSSHDDFDRTCRIAETCGLSSYDAVYVAFAARRGARLLTLDRAMAAAAVSVGVATLPV
jgi:predicted nucleic acid-binding protein